MANKPEEFFSPRALKWWHFLACDALWQCCFVMEGYRLRSGDNVNLARNTIKKCDTCLHALMDSSKEPVWKQNKDCQTCLSSNFEFVVCEKKNIHCSGCFGFFLLQHWHKQFNLMQVSAVARNIRDVLLLLQMKMINFCITFPLNLSPSNTTLSCP